MAASRAIGQMTYSSPMNISRAPIPLLRCVQGVGLGRVHRDMYRSVGGGHDVFVSSLRQHGLYCPERATRVPGPNNNLGDTPPSKSKAKCAPDMEREVIETGLPGLRSCSAPILPDIGQRGRSGVPIPDYNRSAHLAELHGGDLPTDALDVSDYDHSAQSGGRMGDLLDNALSVIVLKVARSIRRERFAIPLQLAFKNP